MNDLVYLAVLKVHQIEECAKISFHLYITLVRTWAYRYLLKSQPSVWGTDSDAVLLASY